MHCNAVNVKYVTFPGVIISCIYFWYFQNVGIVYIKQILLHSPLTIVKAERPMVHGLSTALPTSINGRDVRPRHVIQCLGAFTVFLSITFSSTIAPLM